MGKLRNFSKNIFFTVTALIAFSLLNRTESGKQVTESIWLLPILVLIAVVAFVKMIARTRSAVRTLQKPDISAEELSGIATNKDKILEEEEK